MTADGRISIAGLNTKNLDYVADAFHAVTKDKKF
jgi:aspartate/tyrosine/aromatic aminotransferase